MDDQPGQPLNQPTLRQLQRIGGADQLAEAEAEMARDARPTDRPDPSFEVISAKSLERAAAPTLSFDVKVADTTGIEVYTVALSVMFTIEPGKRSYDADTRERLSELFGEPERWASTTGAFRWAHVDVLVPSFTGEASFEIQVPCTYDHEIAATKYFSGLADGVVPLQLHFNGTLFYRGKDELGGQLQVMLLPWDLSVRHDLPIEVWREMIADHYPEGAWIRLEDATLDRLRKMKTANGVATYDRVVAKMLDGQDRLDDVADEAVEPGA